MGAVVAFRVLPGTLLGEFDLDEFWPPVSASPYTRSLSSSSAAYSIRDGA